MATKSLDRNPELWNSQEEAITSRKLSRNEHVQSGKCDFREITENTDSTTSTGKANDKAKLNLTNNNANSHHHNYNYNTLTVTQRERSDFIEALARNNSNNNEVPEELRVKNGRRKVPNACGEPSRRPSSSPTLNKYQISHENTTTGNKSGTDNKSTLAAKQMTDDSSKRDGLNKKIVDDYNESLSPTNRCEKTNKKYDFSDARDLQRFAKEKVSSSDYIMNNNNNKNTTSISDCNKSNLERFGNDASSSFYNEALSLTNCFEKTNEYDCESSNDKINISNIRDGHFVLQRFDKEEDASLKDSNRPSNGKDINSQHFEGELSSSDSPRNATMNTNESVDGNVNKSDSLFASSRTASDNNKLDNSDGESDGSPNAEKKKKTIADAICDNKNKKLLDKNSKEYRDVNKLNVDSADALSDVKNSVNKHNSDEVGNLNIIDLNIKETLDKFDEKLSSSHYEISDTNSSPNCAKDNRTFRFRKCYSDSKTCSKVYPVYENVNKMANNNVTTDKMQSLNVKNLERNTLKKQNNVIGNQKYKSRKSYHQDVEEALSSLLWQPYEYQNTYKNSNLSASSSCCSASSCASSSSSCSTISSCDLERSNNGSLTDVHPRRHNTKRNGNAASDLHLLRDDDGELVNNPLANENRLNQWGESKRSRDATELSNASRLMVGVSSEVRCTGVAETFEPSAYVLCECDACLSDMRLEISEDVTPLTSTAALGQETAVESLRAHGNNNNVTAVIQQSNNNNHQHLSIGSVNQVSMSQVSQQRPVTATDTNGFQRSNLSSVNVVGLPRPVPLTARSATGNILFPNHPRHASEPINMVASNQFKYNNNNINCANIVPILSHQRHNSHIIESGNTPGGGINHMRSASVPKTVPPHLGTQKIGESRNASDMKVMVGNDQQQQQRQQQLQQQQPQQQQQQRLPLNVSNVNVNYYRAVPVNVVSSVPTIQCVNTGDTNISNVNIVQAMPVVNTPNNCSYSTCTSSTNFVQNYTNLPQQNVQQQTQSQPQQNFSFPNSPYGTINGTQMQQIHAQPLQQCAVTTFGSSIITQHFPSGSTYNLSTSQVPPVPNNNNVQINTHNSNMQQSTQTHISYSGENNVIQSGTIVVSSNNTNNQTLNSHTFSTAEVTVHTPPMTSQIQVVPTQTVRPLPPPEVRTRTFTSTEAQTDETAVSAVPQNELGTNREQRRRERRERRHHRRVSSTNHRHGTTVDHGTQWNSLQNERLPDILNSHMPPSYASSVNNLPPPQPVLPSAIVSNPIVPPGTVVQTIVPNNIVPSGIVGNPIVSFPAPVVPGQVPLVQGAAPVPVATPSGFRFPFPAAGFRRNRASQ